MKKKRISVLFIVFALTLSISAYADIPYMPNDDFAEEHLSECLYENRYYLVNSPEGSIVAYSSPTGSAKLSLPNGLEYYVSQTWEDGGTKWGCIEYNPETLEIAWGADCESAWVDMSLMTPRYDSKAFRDEYSKEIEVRSRSLAVDENLSLYCYRYPGSGIVEDEIAGRYWEGAILDFQQIYTDGEGREWGYLSYYMGFRDMWICLDDPYSILPPGDEYTEPIIYSAASAGEMDEALNEARGTDAAMVILAVSLVIIAAAIAAYIIIRRRKRA